MTLLMGCHLHAPMACRGAPGISNPLPILYACTCMASNDCIIIQKGHVLRVVFTCRCCQRKRNWSSSGVLANHFLVNQKYVQTVLFFLDLYYFLLGSFTALFELACFQFSILSLHSLLGWECLEHPSVVSSTVFSNSSACSSTSPHIHSVDSMAHTHITLCYCD